MDNQSVVNQTISIKMIAEMLKPITDLCGYDFIHQIKDDLYNTEHTLFMMYDTDKSEDTKESLVGIHRLYKVFSSPVMKELEAALTQMNRRK